MVPIIFIVTVSLILVAMLYWVLRSAGEGERRTRHSKRGAYQFESAQELFKYVDDEVYLREDGVQLVRINENRMRALWNLGEGQWQDFNRSGDQKNRGREAFMRVHQAGEHLRTIDMPLRQRSGHFDYDLSPGIATYFSIGFKENNRFYPVLTSRTILRQC